MEHLLTGDNLFISLRRGVSKGLNLSSTRRQRERCPEIVRITERPSQTQCALFARCRS